SCRIIPERGIWVQINVTQKECLGVRIDQNGKSSAITLLRAMDPSYSTDDAIIRAFYPTETVKLTPANRTRVEGAVSVGDVIDPDTAEVYLESGEPLTKELVDKLYTTGLKEVNILAAVKDPLILL